MLKATLTATALIGITTVYFIITATNAFISSLPFG